MADIDVHINAAPIDVSVSAAQGPGVSDVAGDTVAATAKATPVDADLVPLVDSAASNVLKKLSWANLKAALKSYLDTLYQAVLVSGTNLKTVNGTSLLGPGNLSVGGDVTSVAGRTGDVTLLSADLADFDRQTLVKADRLSPAFAPATGAAGAQSIVLAQAISVLLPSGVVHHFPTDTAVVLDDLLPAEWPGTDWAIHVDASGAISATRSFTAAEGGVIVGGFHYAMGSNAHIPENADTFYGDGPALTLGITDTQIDTGDFYYRLPGGDITYQVNYNIDLALGADYVPDSIPAGKWGLFAFVLDSGGFSRVRPAAGNGAGYSTEALALSNLENTYAPATERLIGHITVQANAGAAFVPGTDALEGGATGSPAQQTHYYSGSSMGPSINKYSIWDLNWRPTCPDPRGMACIAGKFWMDIYLTNNRPDLYGTSAANVTIADGSSRAARPVGIGGKSDGSLLMPSHNWWDSDLLAGAYGKSHPSLDELQDATLGATGGVATVWDRGITSYYGALTSMYGLCQAFGQNWVWATDAGDSGDRKALMGGFWGNSGSAGPRYVNWSNTATNSASGISSRFRADHLIA